MFRGAGWDGILAHWRAKHESRIPYTEFWSGLCPAHRQSDPPSCPSCRKGIPIPWISQCPECAQVFAGKGWEGIDAHWRSRHAELTSYEDFWQSLCPGHRGAGDGASGFLPFSRRR